MKWSEKEGLSLFLKPSGFTGLFRTVMSPEVTPWCSIPKDASCRASMATAASPSSQKAEAKRTLVDNYQGKRLNSPNDLVYKSNGDLYFTDPPYGLPSPESLDARDGLLRRIPLGEEWRDDFVDQGNVAPQRPGLFAR